MTWLSHMVQMAIKQAAKKDMVLVAHIREQYDDSVESYGRARMTRELRDIGLSVGHRRVGRLMRLEPASIR